jgi:hypothetical protein
MMYEQDELQVLLLLSVISWSEFNTPLSSGKFYNIIYAVAAHGGTGVESRHSGIK